MAESLYRKYRPQIFEDVVGQEHIERTLKNAIEQDKVSHAYLFCGPRGTGKTTTARLLAKALLCEKGPTPDPDGTCEDCRMIANGEHPDVNELDAASRTGVENVREEIIGRVQFAPVRGRYKVYIIDEVHMLSPAAFNALLKTLEEPPSHVVFILCTTDPQKVPETIHSRCQRFDFRRILTEAMVSRLGAICVKEGVEFEGEALDLIAHRADGGMRNALTSLEQVIVFADGAVTLEAAERVLGSLDSSDFADIMGAIGKRDAAACFRWVADYVETGADLAQFTRDLAVHVRNLYVMTLAGADVALEVGASERRELESELPLFAPDRLARLLGILGDLSTELKTSTNPRLSFEIALTRMVRPDSDLTLESLAERVEALEAGYSAVAHVSEVPAPAASQAGAAGASAAAAGRPAQSEAAFAQQRPAAAFAEGARSAAPAAGAAAAQVAAGASGASAAAGAAFAQGGAAGAQMAQERAAQPVAGAAQGGSADARFAQQPQPGSAAQPQPQPQPEPAAQAAVQAQPQPAAQPTTQPAAASGGVSAQLAASLQNPASLQRMWQSALTTLKKEKAAYGVLFLNTKAVFDAAMGSLAIDFPVENTFAFKAAQKPDVQDAVSSALLRACGEQLAFSYTQGTQRVMLGSFGGAAAAGAQASASSAQPAGQQPQAQAQVQAQAQPQPAAQAQPEPATQARPQRQGGMPQPDPAAQPAGQQPRAQAQVQPQQAKPQPVSAAPAPSAVPYDDVVPYDDDAVPYDDDAVPYDDASAYGYAPAPAMAGAVAPGGAVAAAGRSAQPAGGTAGGPQTASATAPAGPQPGSASATAPAGFQTGSQANASAGAPAGGQAGAQVDDLQAILAAGFGDGVTFEEVRE